MVKYKHIMQTIEDYVGKCNRTSPTRTSGIQHRTEENRPPWVKDPKPYMNEFQLNLIANEMAQKYNLEVSVIKDKDGNETREIGGKKFRLWDNEHQTLLSFDDVVQHRELIDFVKPPWLSNSYAIGEIIEYYTVMPDVMKDATGGIFFSDKGGASSHYFLSEETENIPNGVIISSSFMRPSGKGDTHNLQSNMYHECGHAVDCEMDNKLRKIVYKGNENYDSLTKKEKATYNRIRKTPSDYKSYKFSNTVEYDDMMKRNDKRFASDYAQKHFTDRSITARRRRCEDFAETMMMIAFENLSDKNNAKITNNSRTEDYSTFYRGHIRTSDFCSDILKGKSRKLTTLHRD